MTVEKNDKELIAIKTIIDALNSLDDLARQRVLSYVFERLNIAKDKGGIIPSGGILLPQPPPGSPKFGTVQDIRTLKEEKSPKTDKEMAAIVAYYLMEVAPPGEKRDYVTNEDIEKYFKQAGYELPKHIRMTLITAKNAGYFDQIGPSKYKLNPVGYNLVVHNLPRESLKVHKSYSKKR
jgi:hypothetical protein